MMVKGKILKLTTPNPYIPHDILFFGILVRLPVKSLLRFKCVSKLWYAIIGEPDFIEAHLTCTKEQSTSSIVGFFHVKYKDTKKAGCEYIFVNKEGHRYFSVRPVKWTSRVGDCNGLFCFRSRSGFEIWNPSTREFLYHPLPPPPPPPPRCFISYGFGFDPLKNEYKVVQIVHGEGNFRRCMVYTLGANNCSWKDITVASNLSNCLNHSSLRGSKQLGGIVNSDRALYSNRALHWFFRRPHIIMSFDIHYEKLSLILGPNRRTDLRHCRCFLIKWQGCLCIAFHSINGGYVILFRYLLKHHDHSVPGQVQEGVWDEVQVNFPYKLSSLVGVLGGGYLLYWFTKGHLSLYSTEKHNSRYIYGGYGSETKVKFPLQVDMDDAILHEYKFHHVENLLSLNALMPASPSPVSCKKDKSLVQVKSVSSL